MSLVDHRRVVLRMVDGLTAHDVLGLASYDDFAPLLVVGVNSRSSFKLVLAYGA